MRSAILLTSFVLLAMSVSAQERSYGRSMVINDHGIVATSHVLASRAGAQILARGGSAIDAAIAANAVLGFTEPMMNGIGGDLFLIYWDAKSGKLYGLNASGWAPRGLSIDFLKKRGITAMPQDGIHSVTVPGTVEGWSQAHKRFGKLPWKEIFGPAIYYAEHGYPVPEFIHGYWADSLDKLKQASEAQRIYLPHGKPPEIGEMFSNPDLAKALLLIAQKGRDAFYRGEIAQAILKTSAALWGTMQADDLAEFSAEWVELLSIDYRGWRVYELPPNGQGMAALEMLNIMETSSAAGDHPSNAIELHKRIEAMKLAYSDVWRYNGDPRHSTIPVETLLSKGHAKQRAGMNLQQALETPRFTKFNPSGCDVLIESRVPAEALRELNDMGHEVAVRREYTQEMGRGQAILHDAETGTNYAASDPRADGAATP